MHDVIHELIREKCVYFLFIQTTIWDGRIVGNTDGYGRKRLSETEFNFSFIVRAMPLSREKFQIENEKIREIQFFFSLNDYTYKSLMNR